jgi:hypothetical protein
MKKAVRTAARGSITDYPNMPSYSNQRCYRGKGILAMIFAMASTADLKPFRYTSGIMEEGFFNDDS